MRARSCLISIAVMIALALCMAAPAVAASFSDVPSRHIFYSYITELSDAAIGGGFPDGTFRLDDRVTRQQMAKILVLAMDKHTGLEEAAAAGYFIGKNGMFTPAANITRVQLALVLVRAGGVGLQDPPAGYHPGFTDIPGFSCHTDVTETGRPFFKNNMGHPTLEARKAASATPDTVLPDSLMTFRVGVNPKWTGEGDTEHKQYSVLRHVPVDADVFTYTGVNAIPGLIPNMAGLPIWKAANAAHYPEDHRDHQDVHQLPWCRLYQLLADRSHR